jgi:VanZ family protein
MRRWFINWIQKYRTTAWIAWAVVVFILHAFPGEYIPEYNWTDMIALDKWIHATMFFSGVYILRFSMHSKFRIALVVLTYAFFLELFQLFIASNRSFDWLDLMADGAGAVLALFF